MKPFILGLLATVIFNSAAWGGEYSQISNDEWQHAKEIITSEYDVIDAGLDYLRIPVIENGVLSVFLITKNFSPAHPAIIKRTLLPNNGGKTTKDSNIENLAWFAGNEKTFLKWYKSILKKPEELTRNDQLDISVHLDTHTVNQNEQPDTQDSNDKQHEG